MRDTSTVGGAVGCLLAISVYAFAPASSWAQEMTFRGGPGGPTVEKYLKDSGPDAKLVSHGDLTLDGKRVNCGKRPTVINNKFDSWGGAFPGFLILNTEKISGLSTAVKLYIYSHECGHQFEGPDETKADLFAIRRGVRWGWLDAVGMEEICVFISTLKGDSVHPPGPQRCETMRRYYQRLIESGGTRSARARPAQAPPAFQPHTLAPE